MPSRGDGRTRSHRYGVGHNAQNADDDLRNAQCRGPLARVGRPDRRRRWRCHVLWHDHDVLHWQSSDRLGARGQHCRRLHGLASCCKICVVVFIIRRLKCLPKMYLCIRQNKTIAIVFGFEHPSRELGTLSVLFSQH